MRRLSPLHVLSWTAWIPVLAAGCDNEIVNPGDDDASGDDTAGDDDSGADDDASPSEVVSTVPGDDWALPEGREPAGNSGLYIVALVSGLTDADASVLSTLRMFNLDKVASGESVEVNVGNALPLRKIPLGTTIHNIELKIGKGGQLVRSAGVGAQLMAKEGDYAQVRLPSGEVRRVHVECFATVGQVGNLDHENVSFGKAGRRRWLGKKPHNRGVSMNPVDHPMGGGEGKTSGGRHPCSPWGQPSKGFKTRNNQRTDGMIVRRRNQK